MCKAFWGIFWIKALSPIDAIVIQSEHGTLPNSKFCSKSSRSYNHKAAWHSLDKTITSGHLYNYYPRGRVEIRNEKAFVYVNENVICEEFESWVEKEFNLTELKQVRIIADMSKHYLCHLYKEGEQNE